MANKNFAVKNGLDVAGDATLTGDLTVLGADIKGPSSTTALTLDQYGNVNVAGDLTISGNELYSGTGRIAYLVGTELELTGSLRIDGNTIKASDNATNITMTSNTLTAFAGDIKVTGNDIQDSTNTNAVSLMPNGVRSQRFVRGAIRDATADGNGDIGRLGNLAYSGVSLSNDTTYDTTYNAFWLRNYSGSGIADPRTLMLMEGARGTSASPISIGANNTVFRLIGSGFAGANGLGTNIWPTDSTAPGSGAYYPFELRAIATETWVGTAGAERWGTKFQVRAQPSGVVPTGPITLIDHNPAPGGTSTYKSDVWNFYTASLVDPPGPSPTNPLLQFSVDVSGNMVLTGDLRINGNDISNSTGNTAITMASGATPAVTFSGDIRINGGDILNSTGDTTITMFSGANANTVFAGNIKVNGDNIKASDGSDNITLTSSTLTTFAGDIKINGLDIQNNTGNNAIRMATGANPNVTFTGDIVIEGGDIRNPAGNTAMTMTSANTNVAFANDIQIIGDGILDGNNEYRLAFDFGPESAARIIKNNNGSFFTCEYFEADSASDAAQFETYIQPTVGSTLTGWNIGKFKFHGYDGTNFQVGGELIANATEDWTTTEQGTELVFSQRKVGDITDLQTLTLRSDVTTLQSDQFVFNDSTLSQLVSIDSSGNVVIAGDLQVTGNDIKASTGNTNITLTDNTLTTFAGDIRINGNDIQASDGLNNITMTSNTLTEFAGDIKVTGNDIQNNQGLTNITLGSSLTQPSITVGTVRLNGINGYVQTTTGALNLLGASTVTITDGIRLHSPTVIGSATYTPPTTPPLTVYGITSGSELVRGSTAAGTNIPLYLVKDKNTTARAVNDGVAIYSTFRNTTSDVTGAAWSTVCTDATAGSEDYDFTVRLMQNGAAIAEKFRVASTGDATIQGDVRVNGNDIQCSSGASTITMTSANTATTIRGDTIYLQTAASAAQTSAGISYTRTYGEFAYTAGTITIAAQNTVYAFPLDTTLTASGVTISNTSRVNINVSGYYKIIMSLQAAMEVNSVGQFDFWLRKNGTDVANSATQVDLLKDQKSVIAMDWLVESDGNDYWEIMYASNSANYADLDFPYIAAWTTPTNPYARPAAPPILVNVIPAGM